MTSPPRVTRTVLGGGGGVGESAPKRSTASLEGPRAIETVKVFQ